VGQKPTRKGFGRRIIEQMIGQLKGEIRFEWRVEGLVCEIRRERCTSCQSKIQNGDLHHSAKSRSVPSFTMRGTVMLIYEDLVELARMCARNARITTTREVADELWRMAKEYQAQAAEMGDFPEIGDEPPLGSRPPP
jgi:hypothetical protein